MSKVIEVRVRETIRRARDNKLIVRKGTVGQVDAEEWSGTRPFVSVSLAYRDRKARLARTNLEPVRYGHWDTERMQMIGFSEGMVFDKREEAELFLDPSAPHVIVAVIPDLPVSAPDRAYVEDSPPLYSRAELDAMPFRIPSGEKQNGRPSILSVARFYDIPTDNTRANLIATIMREQVHH